MYLCYLKYMKLTIGSKQVIELELDLELTLKFQSKFYSVTESKPVLK